MLIKHAMLIMIFLFISLSLLSLTKTSRKFRRNLKQTGTINLITGYKDNFTGKEFVGTNISIIDDKRIIFLRPSDNNVSYSIYIIDVTNPSFNSPGQIVTIGTSYTLGPRPTVGGVLLSPHKYIALFSSGANDDRMSLIDYNIPGNVYTIQTNFFPSKAGYYTFLQDMIPISGITGFATAVKYFTNSGGILHSMRVLIISNSYQTLVDAEFLANIENTPHYPVTPAIGIHCHQRIFYIPQGKVIFFITVPTDNKSFAIFFVNISTGDKTLLSNAYIYHSSNVFTEFCYSYDLQHNLIVITYLDSLNIERSVFLRYISMNTVEVVYEINLKTSSPGIVISYVKMVDNMLVCAGYYMIDVFMIDFGKLSVDNITSFSGLSGVTYDIAVVRPYGDGRCYLPMSLNSSVVLPTCLFIPLTEGGENVCRSACDGDYQFLTGFTCLQCTKDHPYNLNNSCVSLCSTSNLMPYLNTLTNSCVSSCPPSLPYVNMSNQCVTTCPIDQPYIINTNNCIDKCPAIKPFVENNKSNNNICLESCPNNLVNYNYRCYNSCPVFPTITYQDGRNCYEKCPPGKFGYKGICTDTCPSLPISFVADPIAGICVDCATIGKYKISESSCATSCPSNLATDFTNSICVDCKLTQKFLYNGECKMSCPEYTYIDSNAHTCTNCLSTSSYYYKGKCVWMQPYSTEIVDQRFNAVVDCQDLTPQKYAYSTQCVSTCPDGYVPMNNKCSTCKEYLQFFYEGSCLSACPSDKVQDENGYTCIDCKLTINKFYYKNSCLSECPRNSVINATSLACTHCGDSGMYYSPRTATCLSLCPDNTLTDDINFNCVEISTYDYAEMELSKLLETFSKILINSNRIDITTPKIDQQIIQAMDAIGKSNTNTTIIDIRDSLAVQSTLTTENEIFLVSFEAHKYGLSTFNITECEKILKIHYNIPYEIPLRIVKVDFNALKFNMTDVAVMYSTAVNGSNIVKILVYSTHGERLDLSLCNETKLTVNIPMAGQFNSTYVKDYDILAVNIFNSSDDFFNDICFPFADDFTDLTLFNRRQEVYQNMSLLCSDDCSYDGLNCTTGYVSCKCVGDVIAIEAKFIEHPINLQFTRNYDIFKCYKHVFDSQIISQNFSFYIMIVFLTMEFISVIFSAKFYEPITPENFGDMHDFDCMTFSYTFIDKTTLHSSMSNVENKNNKNNNSINISIPIPIPPNPPRSSLINSHVLGKDSFIVETLEEQNPKTAREVKHPNGNLENIQHSNNSLDAENMGRFRVLTSQPHHLFPETNQIQITDEKPHVSKLTDTDIESEKANFTWKATNENRVFTTRDYREMKFQDILIYDKRSFCEVAWQNLIENHSLFSVFFQKSLIHPIYIRVCLLFFSIIAEFSFNAIFYSEVLISNRHKVGAKSHGFFFTFANEFPKSLMCSMLSALLGATFEFLVSPPVDYVKTLNTALSSKNEFHIRYTNEVYVTRMKVRYICFFLAMALSQSFLTYYTLVFCAIYQKTQYAWFQGGLLSFLLRTCVLEVAIPVLRVLNRMLAIKIKSRCLYDLNYVIKLLGLVG